MSLPQCHHRLIHKSNDSLPSTLLSGLPDSVDGIGKRRGWVYIKDPRPTSPRPPNNTPTPKEIEQQPKKMSSPARAGITTTTTNTGKTTGSFYPVNIAELTRKDWTQLTEILHIEKSPRTTYIIKALISDLPSNLSRHFVMQLVPNFIVPAATLCDVHRGMNPHVVSHVFELLQWEVGFHLDVMLGYPRFDEETDLASKVIIENLRALRGMWMDDDDDDDNFYDDLFKEEPAEKPKPTTDPETRAKPWSFQINRCEACMLARVGSNTETLRELRITLLSRTRTRKKHRVPRLVPFVDGCVNHHKNSFQVFHVSSELAFAFKSARKAAVRHYLKYRRKGRQGQSRKSHESDHDITLDGGLKTKHHKCRTSSIKSRIPQDKTNNNNDDGDSIKNHHHHHQHSNTINNNRTIFLRRWLGTEPLWIKGDRGSRLSPKPQDKTFVGSGVPIGDATTKVQNIPNYSTEHLYQDEGYRERKEDVVDGEEEEEEKKEEETKRSLPSGLFPLENEEQEQQQQVKDMVFHHHSLYNHHIHHHDPPPQANMNKPQSQSQPQLQNHTVTTQPEMISNSNTLIPEPLFSNTRKSEPSPSLSTVERKGSMTSSSLSTSTNQLYDAEKIDLGDDLLSDVDDDNGDDKSMRWMSPAPVNSRRVWVGKAAAYTRVDSRVNSPLPRLNRK